MRFSFIHAADLHIDSPLAALGRRNADAAALVAEAGRKAVTALIDETLRSEAAFLIIAGDIFDGDWSDYTTGLFFAGELARLERAGIRVFMVRGNHDAKSKITKALQWPDNVTEFSARKAESVTLPELNIVLHGKSFTERNVPDDFVDSYPARREGALNIGVLHTALDGVRGHASYAPCTVDSLSRFGYDYWALGHIHKPEIVARDPWIVFPGNVQGRSVRETGPRGAMRVTVDDGRITNVDQVILDAARWAHETVDISAYADENELLPAIGEVLNAACDAAGGRMLATRLTLSGETPLHGSLAADFDRFAAECQSQALRISDNIWIEKIVIATCPPASVAMPPTGDDALDIAGLLQAAAKDPAFSAAVASLANDIRSKLPADLREEFDAQISGAGNGLEAVVLQVQALLAGSIAQDAPV